MVSQAEEIRNLIDTNWALTGRLSKTATTDMQEIVRFFDRVQVEGNEWPKAITVEKINDQGDENTVEHPNFTEVADIYQITVLYRVVDVQVPSYSEALQDVEDMAREVQRILEINFNPSNSIGGFFIARRRWSKNDHLDSSQPELRRILNFELTKFISETPTVFTGFGGVLTFDTSDSEGDNKPGADYIYTELRDVSIEEGYAEIDYLTKDTTLGRGVPHRRRGMFSGKFTALLQAKKEDIDGTTVEKLENIYKTQASAPVIGQVPEVVFFHANNSLETVPSVLTTKSFMRIDRMQKINGDENLLQYRMAGILTRPTEYTST